MSSSHDGLVAPGGAYAAIWRAQNAERKPAHAMAAESAA